jgi:formylglycine-generating enzyme required for sulfatase activity
MVSPFRLDTYEVTVGRFRAFVDAGRGTQQAPPMSGDGSHPTIPASGWSTSFNASLATDTAGLRAALSCGAYAVWTDTPGTREDRAMSCVTWFEAMAFCAWDGGRLPTEAEWNYAAAGGSDQRPYPWSTPSTSTAIDETRASFYVDATLECYGDQVNGCTVDDNIRVGSRPAGNGAFGHADLAGNVFEWVLDTYATPYAMVPCMDCADLEQTNRVVRGGSLNGVRNDLRTAYRLAYVPGLRAHVFGFRCARAP